MTARKKIGESSNSLVVTIAIVAIALVVVVGVAIGLLLSKSNPSVELTMPGSSEPAPAAPANSSDSRPSDAEEEASRTSSSTSRTTSSGTESSRTSTSETTGTSTAKTETTSRRAQSTQTTRTRQSDSSGTTADTSRPATSPNSEPQPSATTAATTATTGQDFGTGRTDLDGRGFTDSAARCHEGDRAFAVLATTTGTKTAACESRSGYKYYRGATADGASLETPIIVDEGDRIVAQNGSWKYQMSPEGLLITENNVVKNRQAASAWGTA